MARRFADKVSEGRGDAIVQRAVAETALAEVQRMKAAVNGTEQARKQQVRAEHARWKALPWFPRIISPEPPRIDMFGRMVVRAPKEPKPTRLSIVMGQDAFTRAWPASGGLHYLFQATFRRWSK